MTVTWGEPDYLWGLAAIAVLTLLRWAWRVRLRQLQAGVGAGSPALTTTHSSTLANVRSVLLFLGLMTAIVALAQPRWGTSDTKRSSRGANIVVLLDCSRSMLADDLYPNRLEAARDRALQLFEEAPEHRIALMPFAAIPRLRCPLTADHNALERLLKQCTPDLFPASYGLQGTAIGEAVIDAVDFLADKGDRGRAILILSDGSDPDSESVNEAAKAARNLDIPVYGLFLGDPSNETTLLIDGREEIMRADRSTLDELAEATGAISVNATTERQEIAAINAHIRNHIDLLPWEENQRIVASDRFQFPLIPAIILLALGAVMPTRRNREERT